MKLAMTDVAKLNIFVSSSMAPQSPRAIESRNMLQVVGKRYELFTFQFIENEASPGDPDDEMRARVKSCDAIVMLLHKEKKSRAIVRPGILQEYNLAVEHRRPIFMFTEQGFVAKPKQALMLDAMRQQKKIFSYDFANNRDLVDAIERSLVAFLLREVRERLEFFGQRFNADVTLPENE